MRSASRTGADGPGPAPAGPPIGRPSTIALPAVSMTAGDAIDAARLPEALDMLAPAKAACEAGLAVAPEDAAPVYLRSNVARAAPKRLA